MAKKPIITEEVKKQNNMAFKMRSGNKPGFKNMGSSPAKHEITNPETGNTSIYHDHESPAKQGVITPKKLTLEEEKEKIQKELWDKKNPPGPWDHSGVIKPPKGEHTRPKKKSPAKQKLEKGGEGQDENKIFNDKGEHVGDWVDGKKVMHHEGTHADIKESPNKQKIKSRMHELQRLQPIQRPPMPNKPDYPTFEEKNPRLRERRHFVELTGKLIPQKMHNFEQPGVNPKPIEMPPTPWNNPKTKTKTKKKK